MISQTACFQKLTLGILSAGNFEELLNILNLLRLIRGKIMLINLLRYTLLLPYEKKEIRASWRIVYSAIIMCCNKSCAVNVCFFFFFLWISNFTSIVSTNHPNVLISSRFYLSIHTHTSNHSLYDGWINWIL